MNDVMKLELNDTQVMMLKQKTPAHLIRFRRGRGGQEYAFVDGAEVVRALNDAFNWDWDFETDQEEILHVLGVPFEIKVRGKLTVRVNGRQLVKMQYGAQAIEYKTKKVGEETVKTDEPVSLADCYKGAATDAMKKCASELGLFLDLYDSDAGITRASVENEKRAAQAASAQPANEWTHDTAELEKFSALVKEFGLKQNQVKEILKVTSFHAYRGTRADAETALREWMKANAQPA